MKLTNMWKLHYTKLRYIGIEIMGTDYAIIAVP